MASSKPLLAAVVLVGFSAFSQSAADPTFTLALPEHRGQLKWTADGFNVIQSSAKPNGREIGLRALDGSGRVTLLAFLFVFPEEAPLTSAKCREGVLGPAIKTNPGLKMLSRSEMARPGNLPVSWASYNAKDPKGSIVYSVRGFVATGDVCGDLEYYSDRPITTEDADLRRMFAEYRLDENHAPRFADIFVYAQLLFKAEAYKAAAPMFEAALIRLKDEPSAATKDGRRILFDQAGMAYGMSGEIGKARSIFEKAISADPDYPLYYYNLACADAEEKNLRDARLHLQQAFARKSNLISGEAMPDPTKDDSFLPFHNDKEFWSFVQQLQAQR
jgi:hypothetical protein